MPSPSFCRLCQCPLDVESASGLCATCLRTADTTLANPRPTPDTGSLPGPLDSDAPASDTTRSAQALRAGAPTGSFAGTPDTRTHRQDAFPSGPPPLPEPPPGYDLLSRLGGGGMGDVYLAHEHFADRLVAMKFLRLAGNRGLVERFLLELRALAALDHPNIVRVFANDFLRAAPYFTMEYAAGGTLGQWVEKHGPLAPRAAATLMAAIARAVAAAHEKQTLHRDLKPSNILLASHGTSPAPTIEGWIPKVADFGLAKQMDQDTVTAGSGPLGTPNYMPPEQANRKNGEVGPASDVYGLGATLYFLLTGKAPFGSGDAAEIIHRVLTDPVPRPRAVRGDVPLELDGIVVKCLEKETKDRYQTAAALADDLDAFLSGKNVVAPRQTRWRRARRWATRHRMRLATAGLMIAAMVAVAALWPPPPPPSITKEDPDPVAEVRKDLVAGRPATLIGEAFPPAWSFSRLGAPGLSRHADGTCHVASVREALLELCPDPGVDRYRITADLRHLDSVPGEKDPSVGIYFGYAHRIGPDGVFAHGFYAVTFREVWPNSDVLAASAMIRLREVSLGGPPDGAADPKKMNLAFRPLGISPTRPGPWRTVEVSVAPEFIRVRWRLTPESGFEDAADLQITDGTFVDRLRPRKVRTLLPGWSPRSALGLWTAQAGMTVRNVTLTPLP